MKITVDALRLSHACAALLARAEEIMTAAEAASDAGEPGKALRLSAEAQGIIWSARHVRRLVDEAAT